MFPLKGGDQRLLWELEAEWKFVSTRWEDRHLAVICNREDKYIELTVLFTVLYNRAALSTVGLSS